MSDGGKGSKPRPFSVDKETFDNNFDRIFAKKKDNTGVTQNEYQDILSTEDCILEMPGTLGTAKIKFKE